MTCGVESEDEFQRGPGFVNDTDLDIHQALFQADFSDDVPIQITFDFWRALRPGDPKESVCLERPLQTGNRNHKTSLFPGEKVDEVERALESLQNRDTFRQAPQRGRVVPGGVHDRYYESFSNPEFFD